MRSFVVKNRNEINASVLISGIASMLVMYLSPKPSKDRSGRNGLNRASFCGFDVSARSHSSNDTPRRHG